MMRHWSLEELEMPLQAHLLGRNAVAEGFSTDSRNLRPGEVFVALSGERFDGHAYLDQVADKGAVGAVVSRDVNTPLSLLRVQDTQRALGKLGRLNRDLFAGPLVAVTGSSGKTSVKNMLSAIFARQGETLATEGNFNNEIGVPLTLLRLAPEHRFAVVEMGAAKPGDIDYLCQLGRPDIAVLTNAMPAHLEGFGSIDAVAATKGEIFERLGEQGVAVINADSPYADLWRERAGEAQVVEFGLSPTAAVRAQDIRENASGPTFTLVTEQGEVVVQLSVLGKHNVFNALAAAAAALAAGVSLADIRLGLESVTAVAGRMQRHTLASGAVVVDDCYNANPGSVRAAIDWLASNPGRRILVLGWMAELGADSERLHAEVGAAAKAAGIDELWGAGPEVAPAITAFGEGGRWFESREALLVGIDPQLTDGDTVLIKGSRSAGMEAVLSQLLNEELQQDANAGTGN